MPVLMDNNTLLLEAVKWGKEDKVRILLLEGCCNRRTDEQERTALHWACEYGYIRIVYMLLNAEWDIDKADAKKQTPLHIACNHRREDVASCLISLGCDVNVYDVAGNTPLHRAIHMNMETITCLLCKSGARVNVANKLLWTPIHEAARTGNEPITRLLIKHGADVNACTQNRMTPFLTCIFYYKIAQRNTYPNLEDLLKLLIESGCRLSRDDGQWSPLSACVSIDNSFTASLLIYNGCQFEKRGKYTRSLLVDAFAKCESFVTKLMVLSGYQPSPDEVDQCSRRIPAFSRTFIRLAQPMSELGSNRHELLNWLRVRSKSPTSLKEICRVSIRKGLNTATDDRPIVDRIFSLPFPECIKKYIALSDFTSGAV